MGGALPTRARHADPPLPSQFPPPPALPAMPHVDQFVMIALALGLASWGAYAWRRGLRGFGFAGVLFALFYGHTLVVMLAAHCADVAFNTARGRSVIDGSAISYDWRTYSLLLFGALLVHQGARSVRAGLRWSRGASDAAPEVLRATAVVLALVLPTIPIHAFFGVLIGGASALTAGVVAAAARAARAPAAVPRTTGVPAAA